MKANHVKNNNIVICGTGALATLFAARLSASGVNVTLIGSWQDALDAFNENGACVEGETPQPVRAISDPSQCAPVSWALVLVKTWQNNRVAQHLTKCLASNGIALTLQNGLGADDVLVESLGQERFVRGVTTLGVTLISPGIVRLTGMGNIWIEKHPFIAQLIEKLRSGHFSVTVVEDILPHIWGKLVVNSAINPLTAILRIKNRELISDPIIRDLLVKVAREAALVARAHGIVLPYRRPEHKTESVVELTGENNSSMLMDVQRGAPTEIDAINGEVVRLGDKYGVDVSANRTVWQLVRQGKQLTPAELSDMVRLVQP